MRDRTGKEVGINDIVVFVTDGFSELKRGRVIGFTDKFAKIEVIDRERISLKQGIVRKNSRSMAVVEKAGRIVQKACTPEIAAV